MLTHERLLQILSYDPETGWFTWLVRPRRGGRSDWIGLRAGTVHSSGCRHISIDRQVYKAHRLAWFYTHGGWPVGGLDHINGDNDDNRIVNLRLATYSENGANSRQRREAPRALKGSVFHKASGLWRAEITKNYKCQSLGYFRTELEAHEAYCKAAKRIHGEFFCPGYDPSLTEPADVINLRQLSNRAVDADSDPDD